MIEDNKAVIKALNMYGRVPEQYELLNEIERLKGALQTHEILLKSNTLEIERLNNIINEALGIANERFNYYSNHKNNNEEHLEDWGNIFNILLRRDNK